VIGSVLESAGRYTDRIESLCLKHVLHAVISLHAELRGGSIGPLMDNIADTKEIGFRV
jgi:hypothetical protein